MQLVAPRAVRIAVATLAIICTIHFSVSFFVIAYLLSFLVVVRLVALNGSRVDHER